MKTVCSSQNCKVRRHPKFKKIKEMREEGGSFNNLHDFTEENPPEVAVGTLHNHFKKHEVNPLEVGDIEALSPVQLGKVISDRIDLLSQLIEDERDSDPPNKKLIAKLIDSQRKLVEDQLKNREMYYEHQEDEPDKIITEFKKIISSANMPMTAKETLLETLQEELGVES